MGYLLRRWLAVNLPPGLSSGERVVALEIADQVNDDTRIGTKVDLRDVAARSGFASPKQVGRVLGKLSTNGVELRIPIGKREDGTPVYAYEGHRTRFRIPTGLELGREEIPLPGDHYQPEVPPAGDHSDREVPQAGPNGPPAGGALSPSGPPPGAERSPQRGTDSPQSPQERTSSLPHPAAAALEHAAARERDPNSQDPKGNDDTTRLRRYLAGHGVIGERAERVAAYWTERGKGIGWWRACERNGDLLDVVAEAEAAAALAPAAPEPAALSRAAFVASLAGQPQCEHRVPGGHTPGPGGWMACPIQRATPPTRRPAPHKAAEDPPPTDDQEFGGGSSGPAESSASQPEPPDPSPDRPAPESPPAVRTPAACSLPMCRGGILVIGVNRRPCPRCTTARPDGSSDHPEEP